MLFKFVVLMLAVAVAAHKRPNIRCKPHTVFQYECLDCVCLSNGHPSCKEIQPCTSQLTRKSPDESSFIEYLDASQDPFTTLCNPESIFYYDCNTCFCSPSGKGADYCTQLKCN